MGGAVSTIKKSISIAWLLLMLPSLSTFGRAANLDRFEKSELHMGTQFTIALYATSIETANRGFEAAFQRIEGLDKRLTNYANDSELNRLCRKSSPAAAHQPSCATGVSQDLLTILKESKRMSLATGGAFDVTVGPLTRLWRRSRRRKRLPETAAVKHALESVGYQSVLVHEEDRTVELLRPRMKLDLGGIAKGFACDETLEVLSQHGIQSALVNAGGDIVVSAAPPDLPGWRVAIAPIDLGKPKRFFERLACGRGHFGRRMAVCGD